MQSPFNALMNPSDIASGFQKSFDQGQEQARKAARQQALSALASNPDDPKAKAMLMRADPDLAFKVRDDQREEADFQDKQDFNTAIGDYVGAQGSGQAGGADFSGLGQPQTPKDQAFLRMLRIDPIKAMKLQTGMRDNFVNQIETERDTYEWAISRFAGITDDAAYQQARSELETRLGGWGQGIMAEIPPTFPGVEALDQLRMRALDTKEQLSHFQRQANITADNARADRNTDSLIDDRTARRGEQRRYNNQRDATQRRGQDIRGSGRGRQPARETLPVVKTPAEAMALPKGTKFRTPDGRVKIR